MRKFLVIALLILVSSKSFADHRGTVQEVIHGLDESIQNLQNEISRLQFLRNQLVSAGPVDPNYIEQALNSKTRIESCFGVKGFFGYRVNCPIEEFRLVLAEFRTAMGVLKATQSQNPIYVELRRWGTTTAFLNNNFDSLGNREFILSSDF